MERVLIDTNIFIYSTRKGEEPKNVLSEAENYAWDQCVRARALLHHCIARRKEVCMSFISVCEILEGLSAPVCNETYQLLSETFTLLPFEGTASIYAAAFARTLRSSAPKATSERSKLRNDLFILASGVSFGCAKCYTSDADLLKQAARLKAPIEVLALPETVP